MPITLFDLADYTSDLFEYEPHKNFGFLNMTLSEKPENNWNNRIFHEDPDTPRPWVEYYRQSATNSDLLKIDDILFKTHCQEYHSWTYKWDCDGKDEDRTEWCYCEDNKLSAKCSRW
jgi:hypothetical protein